MSWSNYAEKKILDHIFGKSTFTVPTIYIALSKADPGEDGSTIQEPTIGQYAYARKQTAAGDWNAASTGQPTTLSNANDLAFAEATGSWGTITHFALYDAASGGNMIGSGALATQRVVDSGTVLHFAAGDLTVTQD